MNATGSGVIRIGNASGFYGDRITAVREMLDGGPLDFLTGDYLAELTMLILGKDRMRDPSLGYARTFVRQMKESMSLALERNVTIVVNAGGLNPLGLADALRRIADDQGLGPVIAAVHGDDVRERATELGFDGALTANAYLGAFGIAEAINSGAHIVVTGRVTDASLITGPAIARFGWGPTDYDQLAGATLAGHIIECGTQATGGNYSFFTEIPDLLHAGFPIAEIADDGSSVITKHERTGGAVSVGTVTAQLLYEITGARYPGPDVTTRIDTVALTQVGPDRVRISSVRGEAPPPQVKVSLNSLGGFRNEVSIALVGLDIEAKADLIERQVRDGLATTPQELSFDLARTDRPDADTEQCASAIMHIVARDTDAAVVGRAFSNVVVENVLASYPGFTLLDPPKDGAAYGVFTPGYVDREHVTQVVTVDGQTTEVPGPTVFADLTVVPDPQLPEPLPAGPTRRVPLGTIAGSRSGDKGGTANVGVWVRSDDQWRYLAHYLTTDKLKELLPEARDLTVTRTLLPNLRAVNFVIDDILGRGVAYNARFDPQAKGIGEWLRSRHVDIPEMLL